ncbi:MAG: endolytic transglycosylase MltG [Pseudomonadota bacterium]
MSDDKNKTPFGRQPAGGHEYALPPDRPLENVSPRTPRYQTQTPPPSMEPAYQDDGSNENIVLSSANDADIADSPPPYRRSRGARSMTVRVLNLLLMLVFFGALLYAGSVWYTQTEFEARGPLEEETTFVVPKGATFTSIIPGLEEKNIIARQNVLRVFSRGVRAAGKASALKAGEFAFEPGMSMRQVMMQLTEGRAIQYSLTFPEGWTSFRMMERIAADETLKGDVPPIPPEGTMLPQTYAFQKGMTRDQLVQLMRDSMHKTMRTVWNERQPNLPLKSMEEMVTLASIVEKETAVASERPRVAAVFVNRLRKGMRLQTDPTVIYGIWGGQGKPKDRGGLRRSELRKPTPYNTYVINGLPPGPIANPGIDALRAVANPIESDELYFVADGTGGHVFSKTLAEHNANVKKWRAIEAQRKKEAEAAAAAVENGTAGN